MRVLLDECVPARLCGELALHEARTVVEMGWSGIKNGVLLRLAAAEFDCFITVDRNLQFQQNVIGMTIGVVVLHASSNNIDTLRPLMPDVLAALKRIVHGQVIDIRS